MLINQSEHLPVDTGSPQPIAARHLSTTEVGPSPVPMVDAALPHPRGCGVRRKRMPGPHGSEAAAC